MSISVQNSGSWVGLGEIYVQNSGSWVVIPHIYVQNSGSWTEVFTLSLPSITTVSSSNNSYCDGVDPVYIVNLSWSLDDSRYSTRIYRDGVAIQTVGSGVTSTDDNSLVSDGSYVYGVNYFYSDIEGGQATISVSVGNPCGF
jgi:hypothetical protein